MKQLVGGRNRKVYTGKKGGNYYIKGGKKVYFKMKGGEDKHYEPKNWKNIQSVREGTYKTLDPETGIYYALPLRHCKFIRKTIMDINSGDIHTGEKTTVNKNEGGREWKTRSGNPIQLEYLHPCLFITTSHGKSQVFNADNSVLLFPFIYNPQDLEDYYSKCNTFEVTSEFGDFTLDRKFYKVLVGDDYMASFPTREEILDETQANFILNVKEYLKTLLRNHNDVSFSPIDSRNRMTFILKTDPEFKIITKSTGVRAGNHIILMTEDNYKIITRTAEIHIVDNDISPTDGEHKHNTLSGL